MTDKNTQPRELAAIGAHHLMPESIAATIKDLYQIEDGTTERPVSSRDWRTWAGVLARVIEHLAGQAAHAGADTERLDFMISEQCQIEHFDRPSPTTLYRLRWPYREEHQREWSTSGRAAIDAQRAAMSAATEEPK